MTSTPFRINKNSFSSQYLCPLSFSVTKLTMTCAPVPRDQQITLRVVHVRHMNNTCDCNIEYNVLNTMVEHMSPENFIILQLAIMILFNFLPCTGTFFR